MIEENENPFAQWKHIHFVGKFNLDLAHPKLYRYELFSRLKTMYNKNGGFSSLTRLRFVV